MGWSKRTPKEDFKRYIARIMEIIELSGNDRLKEPIKREMWYLYRNIFENGDNENGNRKSRLD